MTKNSNVYNERVKKIALSSHISLERAQACLFKSMTLTAITESQLGHRVPRASFEWPAPYTDWTKAIAVWLPFSENWINQLKLERVTGGFECLNSVLTACWADSTTPFHVNSGGTFVEAPSHCTLDDYDSQFFRTVCYPFFPSHL